MHSPIAISAKRFGRAGPRWVVAATRPHLPGIRVRRVVLSSQPGRAVFVVEVPQGSTAYQANDRRYYGRSEHEIKPLPDHEVRLRMSRGKVARGIIFLRIVDVELGVAAENAIRANIRAREEQRAKEGGPEQLQVVPRPGGKSKLMSDKTGDAEELLFASVRPDLVTFDFVFRNEGELTIRAPAIEFKEARNERLFK